MDNIKENMDEEKRMKDSFSKIQTEKAYYLGEYKERVLGALTKNQLLDGDIYPEIIDLMGRKEAYLLKITREVPLKNLKQYINHAEKIDLKYQLVDGISYYGEIGLVVVSKDALENQSENLVIRDINQDFIDAGLDKSYGKSRGQEICSKHYNKIKSILPSYINEYKKIGILGKIIGTKCPICKAEKENNRRK